MVAVDARTGDILGYVGSAGYYRDDSEKLNPKFDVAGQGFRQPGSAWKPMIYAAGFDNRTLTPGTLLFDVTTEFSRDWVPRNFSLRDYGPVLARQALHYSLNTTAIRALDMVGVDAVAQLAERMELNFPRGGNRRMFTAGLAGAIGTVEVNLLEYTAAFGSFGADGIHARPRSILEIRDANGEVIYRAGEPVTEQAMSEQAAWLVTDILKDNTDPEINPMFGPLMEVVNGPNGERREAASKTGTTNDLRDLSAYGYLAPPPNPSDPQLVVGVWMGNSDFSPPTGGDSPAFASNGPGRIWQAFLREYSRDMPLASFGQPPEGIVRAEIDPWSGGAPGPYTPVPELPIPVEPVDPLEPVEPVEPYAEWFIEGTQPGGEEEVDPAGVLYVRMCDTWFIDPTQLYPEQAPSWHEALVDWTDRARRGPGRRGPHGTATAYLPDRDSWGHPVVPLFCTVTPTPPPFTTPNPNATPTRPPDPNATPAPTPDRTRDPNRTPRPRPTTEPPEPTPTPARTRDPNRTPRPRPTDPPATPPPDAPPPPGDPPGDPPGPPEGVAGNDDAAPTPLIAIALVTLVAATVSGRGWRSRIWMRKENLNG